MIYVEKYTENKASVWNQFNKQSKNSLFMFDRNYMDYHKERFMDHSLLFYDEDNLIALLPLSEHGSMLVSHGGLTYGGFIVGGRMKQHLMNECFDVLKQYMHNNGFDVLRYKCIPHIYHTQPAEEDKYSLFANNASLSTVDASTYLNLKNPLKMPKGRKAQIARAIREGVEIHELTGDSDFILFIELENTVLRERHGVTATHTGSEIILLHNRFPDKIHLFGATHNNKLIAGALIYEYEEVIHTQYMAADDEARRIGALDLTIATLISQYAHSKKWLDFGISTEHDKIYLNEGLISQKEGFGGRTGVYETWELKV